MLTGSMVAVVTPMDSDGAVNYRDFARVVDFHVSEGTEVLVVAGTTGESATLDHGEHVEVLEKACELRRDAFRSSPALARTPRRKR